MTDMLAALGKYCVDACQAVGGMILLLLRAVVSLPLLRFHRKEAVFTLYSAGVRPFVPVVGTLFAAGLLLGTAGAHTTRFEGFSLLGFGLGTAVLGDIGPLGAALLFAAFAGAPMAAQTALSPLKEADRSRRAVAQLAAMAAAQFFLSVLGTFAAMAGIVLAVGFLSSAGIAAFFASLSQVSTIVYVHGLVKAAVFGLAVALPPCHFGFQVSSGGGVGEKLENVLSFSVIGVLAANFLLAHAIF